jgi:mono/diheme cytochrome c family protein
MKKVLFMIVLLVYGLLAFTPGASASKNAKGNNDPPTFSREVVRIFQANCQVCHRTGDIAPFPLMTYIQARAWAPRIKQVTQSRFMPPWKPVEGCGEFANSRRLSDEDIETIARWVDAGAPEGDPADLPPPREFPTGWVLGEPDVALETEEEYMPDPNGDDEYRCFVMPTKFDEEVWLRGVEIQPGNRSIVHHVLLFLDTTGAALDLLADPTRDPGPGPSYRCFGGPGFTTGAGLSGGWAPGARPRFLPAGIGTKIPAGANVVMQVHYHPHGHPESDLTKIGLHFATEPVRQQIRTLIAINPFFNIPAGHPWYPVLARYQIPAALGNIHALAVAPHMHLLGRDVTVAATKPDGQTECLIRIDDWDFNWQGSYGFANPIALPVGTVINALAYYDNSETNPRQPSHPPREVHWGERTIDEMCITFVSYTKDGEDLAVDGSQAPEEETTPLLDTSFLY